MSAQDPRRGTDPLAPPPRAPGALVGVVGAGLSGLIAARHLREAGLRVLVIEEDAEPGGRMGTLRTPDGVWDHGAQFFTARDERFQRMVDAWRDDAVATVWFRGLPPPDPPDLPDDDPRRDEPHFRGSAGMDGIVAHLARGLDMRLGVRATAVTPRPGGWTLEVAPSEATGGAVAVDGLILAAPVPRCLALLARSDALASPIREELGAIRYEPTLAALVLLEEDSDLPDPGAWHGDGDPVSWLADNQRKGISSAPTVTIHAGGEFSRRHLGDEGDDWADELVEAVAPVLGARPRRRITFRWHHATPEDPFPEPTLAVEDPTPLAFAGDAFAGPRVEGAVLSGLAAADALLARLEA